MAGNLYGIIPEAEKEEGEMLRCFSFKFCLEHIDKAQLSCSNCKCSHRERMCCSFCERTILSIRYPGGRASL